MHSCALADGRGAAAYSKEQYYISAWRIASCVRSRLRWETPRNSPCGVRKIKLEWVVGKGTDPRNPLGRRTRGQQSNTMSHKLRRTRSRAQHSTRDLWLSKEGLDVASSVRWTGSLGSFQSLVPSDREIHPSAHSIQCPLIVSGTPSATAYSTMIAIRIACTSTSSSTGGRSGFNLADGRACCSAGGSLAAGGV